jgi:hypothetical protein
MSNPVEPVSGIAAAAVQKLDVATTTPTGTNAVASQASDPALAKEFSQAYQGTKVNQTPAVSTDIQANEVQEVSFNKQDSNPVRDKLSSFSKEFQDFQTTMQDNIKEMEAAAKTRDTPKIMHLASSVSAKATAVFSTLTLMQSVVSGAVSSMQSALNVTGKS